MALINCPECGKEISDKAVSCPNCGVPIAKPIKKEKTNREKKRISNKSKKVIVVGILLCIVIGIVGYFCASKEIEY
ncbi:MAG: zinc ribbon domain-containing protein, partial [Acetivibrio ethanolgignens]